MLPFTRCRSFADTVHLSPSPSSTAYPSPSPPILPPTCHCCTSVTAAHQPLLLICCRRSPRLISYRRCAAVTAAAAIHLQSPFNNRCHSPAAAPSITRNRPATHLLPPLAAHLSLPLIRSHRSPAAIAYLPPPIIDDSLTAAANVTPSVTPLNIRRHRSRGSSVVIYPPLPLTSHRCSSISAAHLPQPPIIRGSHAAAG